MRNVCAKRYLYSSLDGFDQCSWDVDVELQGVESLLATPIWPQVASDFIDLGNATIRKTLALFVATIHVRHPDNRRVIKPVHQQIVENLDILPKKADGSPNVDSFIYKDENSRSTPRAGNPTRSGASTSIIASSWKQSEENLAIWPRYC